ncbi:MAG: hypothetical protein WA110_09490, partial [Anaerolineaceae bacterium]
PIYLPPAGKTATPTPSPTPDLAAWIQLGQEIQVPEGYFAFQPLTTWDPSGSAMSLDVTGKKVSQSNTEETLFFSLVSEPSGKNTSVDACLNMILERMAQDVAGFQSSPAELVSTSGAEGLQSGLSGTLFGSPMIGSLAVFDPQGNCFSLLGLSAAQNAPVLWDQSGRYAFTKLLAGLRFLSTDTPVACQISTDQDYGVSPESPIRVGNTNLYDGLSREEAYLNTLRGSGHQEIYYSRLDPTYNQNDEIVDVYEITYDGLAEPVTLYFDMYHFETPLAPLGYTCEASFPIQAP